MRINKLQVAGLAALVAGGVSAGQAEAGDVTISTATTTPLVTSAPDGVSPGNVTVASTGSITVNAGQAAVTVNSSNSVSNAGAISSNDANNTTGILIQGGNAGTITNSNSISLLESYVLADSDNDGNLDGAWALGSGRNGILLDNGAAFTGDIINSGAITIEGNSSSAITLEALLAGDLNSSGAITLTGDNSTAFNITGGAAAGVTGDVALTGNVTVRGENSAGLIVNAPIAGALNINGAWNVTGFHNPTAPANAAGLDLDDQLIGGPAVAVRYSVAGGITIQGIGVEDDEDDDFDGITESGGDTVDDATASILTYGTAPALLIQADPSANLVVGTGATGFGLHVRGTLTSIGTFNGLQTTTLRIEGSGTSSVSIASGVAIDNALRTTAFEADGTGVSIGNNVSISEILFRRELTTAVLAETAQNAYGIVIGSGATVPALSNTGVMRAQLFGETGNAVVIRDSSNSLATITNSGSIQAQLIPTDADPADGIPPPDPAGAAVAIDVSASSIGVTVNQVADTVFLDDDTIDQDALTRPATLIHGDILFGSGADILNLAAGEIRGDVAFGAGADTLLISNGADYFGSLTDSDGQLSINVSDGTLTHAGGTLNLTTATFGANSELGVTLSQTPGQSTLILASGDITFAPGASIVPIVPAGLPTSGSHVFLTAGGTLFGAANVTGPVATAASPFLYTLTINPVVGDPDSLEAAYIMRTPAQLGLNANQSTAFNPIIDALRLDANASAAFAALPDQAAFDDAYADLMPSYASAAAELAATAIQQSQSAASNRLSHIRLQGLDEVSVWAQEIGYSLERTPPTAAAQEFSGNGFGLAVGIDGPLDNGAIFGLSASFLASEATEPLRDDGEISAWFAQANAYLGTALGPFDLDFVAGGGFGNMRSRRFVEIGNSFSGLSEAEWRAYEGHGLARISMPLAVSNWFVISPQGAVSYVYLSEDGYEEGGGGAALDMQADSATSQRLWADAGIEFAMRWRQRGGGVISPRLYAGYRANAIDEGAERTFRFISGGSDFTLADEPLGEGGPLVGLGIDASNDYSTFSIGYEGEFGDQIERHSINAAIRFRF